VPIFLNSYEVSDDIFEQLSEAKNLIEENRLTKARESLDYMLEWFGDELNPLEIDLIRYFQGEVYLLNNKVNLAISTFNSILKSNILEKDILDRVKIKLSKLSLSIGNSRTALEILKKEKSTKQNIAMRYVAYKNLGEYKKAYQSLLSILEKNPQNLHLWSELINISTRLKYDLQDIDISNLISNFSKKSDFQGFYNLFKTNRMLFQLSILIKKAVFIDFKIEQTILDKAISVFIKYMDFNQAKELVLFILKTDSNFKYKFQLVKLNMKLGDFDESLKILNQMEIEKRVGKIYLFQGDIQFLKGNYSQARKEYFKAYKFYKTRDEATYKLNGIKKFCD